jgi:hypothetical protein
VRLPQTPAELREFLLNFAQTCTSPVWFAKGLSEPPGNVNDNGSCGFVAGGSHRFIVTAWHVLEGFRKAKQRDPATVFAVNIGAGNTVALEEPRVIAESRDLDLATIAFPHLEGARTIKQYFPFDACPIHRTQVGDAVSIVGFSGQGRQGFETFGKFEPFPVTLVVTSVSDRRVVVSEGERPTRYWRHGQEVAEGIELGGFSGSPAIGLNRKMKLFLAGVVSDGSARLGCAGFPGYLNLASAEYLLTDGTLDHGRMPWV